MYNKTHNIKKALPLLFIGMATLFLTSCGTYNTNAYGETDGIYGGGNDAQSSEAYTNAEPENKNNYYKQYFKSKDKAFEDIPEEGAIFTNIDAYSTTEYIDDDGNIVIEDADYGDGYAGWGENNETVTVNVYDYGAYSFGYWHQPFGWYNSFYGGYYGSFWGGGFGWGFPFYGHYGYGSPFFYGNFYNPYYNNIYYNNGYGNYYGNNNIAYNNRGRRNSDYINNRSSNRGRSSDNVSTRSNSYSRGEYSRRSTRSSATRGDNTSFSTRNTQGVRPASTNARRSSSRVNSNNSNSRPQVNSRPSSNNNSYSRPSSSSSSRGGNFSTGSGSRSSGSSGRSSGGGRRGGGI